MDETLLMCSFLCQPRHACLHRHTLTCCSRSPLNRQFTSNISEPHSIQQQGTQNTLISFSNKCSDDTLNLSSIRDLHRQTVFNRRNYATIIGEHLMRMFSSFGSIFEANLVFCVVETPTIYTWHAAIAAHLILGEHDGARDLYSRMLHEGICTGRVTYLCILKVCGNAGALFEGMFVHHQIFSYGVDVDVVLGITLIHMYSSCGAFDDAQCVLDHMANRNVISYNALSTGCTQHGQWFLALRTYVRMECEGIKPNKVTYTSILKACSGLGGIYEGKLIHNEIIKEGGHTDSVIVTSLVDMYAKCGWLQEACNIFGKLQEPDLRAWNAIIAGYVHHDKGLSAMACFEQMQLKGKVPDAITYSTMAKACAITNESGLGRIIHNMIIRAGVERDLVVANMLIDMYARLGCLDDALHLFNTLSRARDHVSWGALIAGLVQQGHDLLAVKAFEKMRLEGLQLSKALFLTILKACSCLNSLKRVKLLHEQLKKADAELDATIGSTLIDSYSKCGDMKEAHAVFVDIKKADTVCWNAIITGYVQNGLGLMSLDLFEEMQFRGVKSDPTTLSSTLKACGCIGAIRQGRLIHHEVAESEAIVDSVLDNTLIDMYAGCGAFKDARIVLDGLLADQNVGSWGALIAGYAQYGECTKAEQCFNEMLEQGMKPDGKVFTSMLAVCSHGGRITKAHDYFQSMQRTYCITPDLHHFNCMIDLLASVGRLKEAKGLIERMPVRPDVTGWMSLLAACRRFGNVSLGRQCFDGVFRLDASIAAPYMLMSNIFMDKNLLHDMQKTLELQRKEGAWKKPATCWIEIEQKSWEFVVGGKGGKNYDGGKANRLKRNMLQDIAYLPHLDLVFESNLGYM